MFWSRKSDAEKPAEPQGEESVAWLWDNEILIEPQNLQVGHFVARMDKRWRDTPFPLEGVMILSEDQRSWFLENCHWLVIDLLRSRNGYRPPRANIPYRRIVRNRTDAENPEAPVNMLRRARLNADTVPESIEGHDLLYRRAGALIDSSGSVTR